MELDLKIIDWTAISSIASLAMVIVTFITLRMNSRQIREMRRARILFKVIYHDGYFLLEMDNIGNSLAEKIQISINSKFLDSLFIPSIKNDLVANLTIPKVLYPNQKYYFLLSPSYIQESVIMAHSDGTSERVIPEHFNKKLDSIMHIPLIISGSYKSDGCTVYHFKQNTTLKEHMGGIVVDSKLVEKLNTIDKSLIKLTKEVKNLKN